MLFFLFVAILIDIHYPMVGLCLISPFIVCLIGGIINLIKTEREIKEWWKKNRKLKRKRIK